MDRDRNLLFGVLAVQFEHITPTQFVHAAEAWAAHPSNSLASHLVEDGALSKIDREFVEAVFDRAIRNSGGTPEAALEKAGGDEAVRAASGGRITLVDSSGISIRTQVEPQPISPRPEHTVDASASSTPQRAQVEEFSWTQLGFIGSAAVMLLAVVGYGYWQLLQDKNEAQSARMEAERALLLLQADRTDPKWKIGLAQDAQFAAEELMRHAERQRKIAETQKSIALESIMKLTQELPPRLIDFPQTRPALRDFLDENAAAIDRILELEPYSDDIERKKAANFALLGSLWGSLGDTDKSIASHQKALAITKRLAEANPKQTQLQHKLALRFDETASAQCDAKDYENAVASFENGLDIYRALLNSDPNDTSLRPAMALTYNNLANAYTSLGASAEARAAYANSLEFNHRALVTGSTDGAATGDEPGRGALTTYDETVQIFKALSATQSSDTPLHWGLPLAYENIGLAYALHGRYEDAQRAFQQSSDLYRASLDADPGNTGLTACSARVRCHRGLVYGLQGDYEKSQDAHAKSFEIAHALLTEDPGDTNLRIILASNAFALGHVHLRFAEYEKAQAEFKLMLEDYMHPSARDLIAPARADSVYPLYIQAMGLLSHAGHTKEALQVQGAYVSLLRYFADSDPDNVHGLSALAAEYVKFGVALRRASRIDEARASFQSGLDILIGLTSKQPENTVFPGRIEPLRQRIARIDQGR